MSADLGETWSRTELPREWSERGIRSSFAGVDLQGRLYAGGTDLYRSSDGGSSWDVLYSYQLGGFYGANQIISPAPGLLFASAYANGQAGVFRSRDDGANWTKLADPDAWMGIGLMSLGQSGSLYAITYWPDQSVYVSADQGDTWQRMWKSPGFISANAVLEQPDGSVLVRSEQGLVRSTDGGSTWTPANSDLPDSPGWDDDPRPVILSLTLVPGGDLYASVSSQGVFSSSDGGATWTSVGGSLVDLGPDNVNRFALAQGRLLAGTYSSGLYRSKGIVSSVTIEGGPAELPTAFKLRQNYPNPFNPTTTVAYELSEASDVQLELFDVMGRRLRVLTPGTQVPGRHEVVVDAAGLPSGIYLYRLVAGGASASRVMTVLR